MVIIKIAAKQCWRSNKNFKFDKCKSELKRYYSAVFNVFGHLICIQKWGRVNDMIELVIWWWNVYI
jgi:hypothetical protein